MFSPIEFRLRVETLLRKIKKSTLGRSGGRIHLGPLQGTAYAKHHFEWFPKDPIAIAVGTMKSAQFLDVRRRLVSARNSSGELCLSDQDIYWLEEAWIDYEISAMSFYDFPRSLEKKLEESGYSPRDLNDLDLVTDLHQKEIEELITLGDHDRAQANLAALGSGIVRNPEKSEAGWLPGFQLFLRLGALSLHRMGLDPEKIAYVRRMQWLMKQRHDPDTEIRILCEQHGLKPSSDAATKALELLPKYRKLRSKGAADVLICAAGSWLCQGRDLDKQYGEAKTSVRSLVEDAQDWTSDPFRKLHYHTVILEGLATRGDTDDALEGVEEARTRASVLGREIHTLPHVELRLLLVEASALEHLSARGSRIFAILESDKCRNAFRVASSLGLRFSPISKILHRKTLMKNWSLEFDP